MLATALWMVTMLGLVAAIVLDGASEFARASVRAAAEHAIDAAMHDALAAYQAQLGAQIAAMPSVPLGLTAAPSVSATVAAAASAPQLAVAYSVTPTTQATPACSGGTGAGSDAIGWLQCHPVVGESRLSLAVTVTVSSASGEPIAQRIAYVTLRLFAQPPYSEVVGTEDGSADVPSAATTPVHEGDVGGDTVAGAAAPQPSPWPSGGTILHVTYRCTDGGWTGPSGTVYPAACAGAAPPDPDARLAPGATWANGNTPAAH